MKKAKRLRRPKGNRELPHVAIATICEKVLKEGLIVTLVRVIDTYRISAEPRTMPPGVLSFVIYVLLKSGDARGTRRIEIVGHSPSGERILAQSEKADFVGEENGVAIECPTKLTVKDTGLYWFDVNVNGRTLSRIPLRISYTQRAQTER